MYSINSYLKKNTALELIESEGYTKDFPEVLDSRVINQDFLLDSVQTNMLRSIYGKCR